MKNDWIKLTEQIPAKGQLCFIKRKHNIYIGARSTNSPIVTAGDISQNCFWYGNPIDSSECEYDKLAFHSHFNDMTVTEWQPILPDLV